jgi:hypothetical protein
MINKMYVTVSLDKPIVKDMRIDDINISGTVNQILSHRKKHIKTLSKLLEKIEKIELNINNKNSARAEEIVTEITEVKPVIMETIDYLKCENTRKTTRGQYRQVKAF